MFNQLAAAIALASKVHENQKYGKSPYILHPLRVMMKFAHLGDEELMTIAILHDVVEDSKDHPIGALQVLGFSQRVVKGVDALSRRDKEEYEDFIKRCAKNPDAVKVKMADLEDNSDISHLKGVEWQDVKRLKKYHKAYLYLKNV